MGADSYDDVIQNMEGGNIRSSMRRIKASFLLEGMEDMRHSLATDPRLANSVSRANASTSRPSFKPNRASQKANCNNQAIQYSSSDPFILRPSPPYSSPEGQKQRRKRRKCLVGSKRTMKASWPFSPGKVKHGCLSILRAIRDSYCINHHSYHALLQATPPVA